MPGSARAGFTTPAPNFTKVFVPDVIGPDSTSALTFTIDNSSNGTPREDLAFTDTLPSGMTIATPSGATTTCLDAILTAPDGGSTITLSEGGVGAGQSCTVTVNVTAESDDASDTTYTNTSSALSYTGGTGGTATDDLDVDIDRPGFTKSFTPPTVPIGGRSTLTFTIDNSANASNVLNLDFTDTFPPGMSIADPALASTDCGTAIVPPTLTADPGTSTVILDANGTGAFPAVAAAATCTVVVDVVGGAVGTLENTSGDLQASFESAGAATASLEVTGVTEQIELTKEFTDDPVAPGGLVDLEFSVTNKSRSDAATAVTFTDDLDSTIPGLAPSGPLPTDPCGAGSTLGFSTGILTLTGGSLAPEAVCTFSVALTVPSGSTPATYPNTAGPVSGDVGGSPETGNVAGDLLFVVPFPVLTKEFTDDPVAAGSPVTLEFTVTNTASSAITDIEFLDELTDGSGGFPPDLTSGFLPFPVSVTLPPVPDPPCGPGSSLALVSVGTDRQGLELTGGSLAATGNPGDSCTFSVTVDIPVGFPSGTYTNTTEEITATVGGGTVTGPPASDDAVVVGAPQLTKEFTDDPVPPGGTATVEFTLTHEPAASADAIGIAFTDDLTTLAPAIAGLTASSVGPSTCTGATIDISTPTVIAFSGGTLTPGSTCSFTVALSVPAAAGPGVHTNTVSDLTATVGGVAVVGTDAEDDLLVTGLLFSKSFANPVIAGDTTTLTFTLDNTTGTPGTGDATITLFTDSLSTILPGLSAVAPLPTEPCGVGSTITGTTFLTYTGGSIPGGTSCSFDVTVEVPAGSIDGTYANITSSLSATIGGSGVTLPPATADLVVESSVLALTKEFTNDPVAPGDEATLVFTLENLSGTATVTDIAFSDDLDATLTGLEAVSANANTCGGMAGFPVSLFSYAGGTLAPGATCTISIQVELPAGPVGGTVFSNTTSAVTGLVGTLDVFGDPASDDLAVNTAAFSKAFDGPTTATGTAVLTFTIDNLDSASALNGLAFSDDLDAVLSGLAATVLPTDPCGAGSVLAGTSFLTLTNGSIPPSGSCSFPVTVSVPSMTAAGTYTNITSDLFATGTVVDEAATADLVIEPPPTFVKEFAPDTIAPGGTSTLTFTIDNSASAVDATGLAFVDTFPSDVVIADPTGASTTCVGMGDATAGAGSFTFSGSVAAGATCTISLDVTSAVPGTYVNTTDDLTSSSGNSGTATDTLTVSALVPPSFAKVFAPDQIASGDASTLTFTIDNSASLLDATGVVVDDNFPTGLEVADPANASTTCAAGTESAAPGDTSFTFTGGLVAAGATCTISVDVTGDIDGAFVNTTEDLTSSLGNSGTATDTLTVDAAPTVTIDQAAAQDDPTNAAPIEFTVVFSEPVTGFEAGDVAVTNGTVASISPASGAGTEFTVAVTPADQGIVSATVPAGGATDSGGNTNVASTSTDNEVNYDSIDPEIDTPSITVNNDPGEPGAIVEYVVTTTDEGTTTGLAVSLAPPGGSAALVPPGGLTCTPPSGSFFRIGTTTVTCTATDLAGNSSEATFDVIVIDDEDPTIAEAPDVEQVVTAGMAIAVVFPDPAASDNSGTVTVTCVPSSGSMFNVGATTVTCTAEDPSGNTASTSFTVTVTNDDDLLPATGGGLDLLRIALQLFAAGVVLLTIRTLGRRRPSLR